MTERQIQIRLGVAACLMSLLFVLYLIPNFVSAPSNVPNIVLSPLFWPYTVAGTTCLIGLLLIAAGLRLPQDDVQIDAESDLETENVAKSLLRLAVMAVIMLTMLWALRPIGMVWTSMLTFAATAFLVNTRHPKTAVISAVIVPLVLYAFFAHVAGVAIPQGQFVRLP